MTTRIRAVALAGGICGLGGLPGPTSAQEFRNALHDTFDAGTLDRAGWEPVTLARVQPPGMLVARYGEAGSPGLGLRLLLDAEVYPQWPGS